jgi:predicted Zn-dependent protease
VATHPRDVRASLGLLKGLGDAGQARELATAFNELPADFKPDPRFADARGRIAFDQGRWTDAAAELRTALEQQPGSKEIAYRLQKALDRAGNKEEAARLGPRLAQIEDARVRMRKLYDDANGRTTLGEVPDYNLYQAFAKTMEDLSRPAEARAWHRLVLRDRPEDPISKPAAARLSRPGKEETL